MLRLFSCQTRRVAISLRSVFRYQVLAEPFNTMTGTEFDIPLTELVALLEDRDSFGNPALSERETAHGQVPYTFYRLLKWQLPCYKRLALER